MNNFCGILKAPSHFNMFYSKDYWGGPSAKTNREASIFTAKNFLRYYKLIFGQKQVGKITGLALIPIIADEPRFKDGIIRRCELHVRIKSTGRKKSLKLNVDDKIISQTILHGVLEKNADNKSDVNAKNPITDAVTQEGLENVPDFKSGPNPRKPNKNTAIPEPISVTDIKPFALIDAKLQANDVDQSSKPPDEEFVRDINPAYSETKIDVSEAESPHEEDRKPIGDPESKASLVETKVLMPPRPASAKKKAVEFCVSEERKKPLLSSLTLIKPGKEMFRHGKNTGWRIKESYQIYKDKQEKVANVRSRAETEQPHPMVAGVKSTRFIADAGRGFVDGQRRKKDAEKRIRESFDAFVARQGLARMNRTTAKEL